jgi:catechol 2,3-dioxygenase-like lactoylglutathione lyase family enzyme
MHLGSIYLIVQDFNKSIQFYEKLLEMPVSAQNMQRFAQFEFEGNNISIMNGYFDAMNPNLTVCKGVFCKRKFLTFANFFPHPIGGEFLIIAAIFQLFILRLLSRNT